MSSFLSIFPWALAVALATALIWHVWRGRRIAALHAAALREHERTTLTLTRIRQAVESSTDAFGIGDMQGNSLYLNRAHLALFGYSVEELNRSPDFGLLFADQVVSRAVHAAIRGGYSWTGETEIRTKDGRVVPCFVRADIIRDEQGRPAGIFGVFTDITERQRARRAIDEERQRLEVTLQSIGDAVIAVDVEGRVVLLNPVAQELTGLSVLQATGRPLREVLHLREEHSRQPCASDAETLLRERSALRAANAYWLVTPSGAERLVAENAALIRTAQDEVLGAVLALRDITRERQRTDEAARTSKLESLGLMAGSIAHDFGNLLTAMVAHLSLAQLETGLPATTKKRLEDIERVVWRARDVTRQLTTFARGGLTQKKPVELGPLLREAASLAVNGTATTLVCEIADELWTVDADEGQLVQVINNLAVNAVQAMSFRGRLTLAAANADGPGDSRSPAGDGRWVRILISDTGPGIPAEHLQKIFEPFFTTKPRGTGLGLATSYSAVRRHGGHLRVESAVGRGTTFEILLPASTPGSEPPFPMAERKKILGRVLVMHEETPLRESAGLMLNLLKYEVATAADGHEAERLFRAAHASGRAFHAVLLDIHFKGGRGGVETISRLREIDRGLKAIAVGADVKDAAMDDYRAAGFSTGVAKPLKMSDLDAALRDTLAGNVIG